MKKLIISFLLGIGFIQAYSQLYVAPTDNFFIAGGTSVVIDSLILIPTANWNIANNTIVKSSEPVPAMGAGSSIARVYNFADRLMFAGTLGLIYKDDELLANPENQLEIAYGNDVWTTVNSSSRDIATNVITYAMSTANSIGKVTATTVNVTLPLAMGDFHAVPRATVVALDWQVTGNELYAGFDVQSKQDNGTWKTIAYIPTSGQGSNAIYKFNDPDVNFKLRQYRLVLRKHTGEISYSPIVLVTRDGIVAPKILVEQSGQTINLHFTGVQPERIQVIDMNGRMILRNNNQAYQYTLNGLTKGMYILRYTVKDVPATQRFMVR